MGLWQIVWVAIVAVGLGINIIKHGEPREGNYNFGSFLIGALIEAGVLYLGGFFN